MQCNAIQQGMWAQKNDKRIKQTNKSMQRTQFGFYCLLHVSFYDNDDNDNGDNNDDKNMKCTHKHRQL